MCGNKVVPAGSKVTIQLKRDDINLLKTLVSEGIDRVCKEKEKYGDGDTVYLLHLVDIRDKLIVLTTRRLF